MKQHLQLNIARLGQLLRNEFSFGNRTTLIVLGALYAVLLIIVLFTTIDNDNTQYDFHPYWFPIVFLVGGYFYSSVSFSELNQPNTRLIYLAIPASTLEKFVSKWLLTTVGWTLLLLLTYWLFSIILNSLVAAITDLSYVPFQPFNAETWLLIRVYFVTQSIYLLAAVWFRKYELFKMIGVSFLLQLGLSLLLVVAVRLIFNEYITNFEIDKFPQHYVTGVTPAAEAFLTGTFTTLMKFLFWFALPSLMWLTAFFKLKETEV